MSEQKVFFGLKNVHYAPYTEVEGEIVYEEFIPLEGAVNLNLTPNGDTNKFFADNRAYYVVTSNQGYEGDLELAILPQKFRTDILGEVVSKEGVLVETNTQRAKNFALAYEFSGNAKDVRMVLYNCSATRPNLTNATTTETTEINTQTLSLTISPTPKGIIKGSTTDKVSKEVYDNWYKKPVLPVVDDEPTVEE